MSEIKTLLQDLDNKIMFSMLTHPTEIRLFSALIEEERKTQELLNKRKYIEILKSHAEFSKIVDEFFKDCMVNHKDLTIKHVRVKLIKRIDNMFNIITDPSIM